MEQGVKNYFDLTDGGYGITFRVHYSQTYDIDTNKSVVAISQIQVKGSIYYGFTHYLDGTIKIDGTTAMSASSLYGTNSVSVGKKDTFASVGGKLGSVTVTHADDGSKSVTITVSMKGVHPTSGTKWSVSGSKTVELTEIPRASVLTVKNGTLGTKQIITAEKKKDTFSHSITYTCGSVSGTICEKSQEESFEFTPPIELAGQNTTGASVLVKFTLQTYSGDTVIASPVSVTVTMAIPDFVKPNCFLTITDAMGYRDVFGGYVQGQSKLNVSISSEMAYGSEIAAYRAEANGDIYTSQSFTTGAIRGAGEQTVAATVTDKRGRASDAAVETINVLEYLVPSISYLSVHRCNEDGTENSRGSFAKVTYSHTITSLSELNEKTVTLKYKKSANYAYTTVELDPVYVSENASYIFAADDGSSYDVILIVADSFTGEEPTQKSTSISTADVVMHWRADAKGIGFGKVSERANALDMGWDIELNDHNLLKNGAPFAVPSDAEIAGLVYPVGSIYLSINSTSPASLFGGTWEQLEDRFLLGAGSTYSAGNTGGESTHTLTESEMPEHFHNGITTAILLNSYRMCYVNAAARASGNAAYWSIRQSLSTADGTTARTVTAGGGVAHNNMPPYLVVYMWKRVA